MARELVASGCRTVYAGEVLKTSLRCRAGDAAKPNVRQQCVKLFSGSRSGGVVATKGYKDVVERAERTPVTRTRAAGAVAGRTTGCNF